MLVCAMIKENAKEYFYEGSLMFYTNLYARNLLIFYVINIYEFIAIYILVSLKMYMVFS